MEVFWAREGHLCDLTRHVVGHGVGRHELLAGQGADRSGPGKTGNAASDRRARLGALVWLALWRCASPLLRRRLHLILMRCAPA